MEGRKRLEYMQPITRVHNIFRIRTIVNAVTRFNEKNRFPTDNEISKVLYENGLSKLRRDMMKDRIMRRARDHLLTSSYLGLLTREGHPFGYSSTELGKMLRKYGEQEECPKDTLEEAVFTDRILRLKLTNVYDMQWKHQYKDLRSRPCLYILEILSRTQKLHEHQIATATGGKRCDPIIEDTKTKKIVERVLRYSNGTEERLIDFYKYYRIGEKDKKNMTRNIRPLLDWCQSVGLVGFEEIEDKRWYYLEERGKKLLNHYRKKFPLWFEDLGDVPSAKAAILLFYQYSLDSGFVFDTILSHTIKVGLTTAKIYELIGEIEEATGLTITNSHSGNHQEIDFTLDYDVPPDAKEEVTGYLREVCSLANVRLEKVLDSLVTQSVKALTNSLKKEHENVQRTFSNSFKEKSNIEIKKIASLIPSVGILSQYRSEFEKEVVIFLKLLDLNAIKYQGQLADRPQKRYISTFFENNPDIFIKNHLECLVECKSSGEWKSPLSANKSVPKELNLYQAYFPAVRSNSVTLIYEGVLDKKSKEFLIEFLGDSKDILFVTKNHLINCISDPHLRQKLVKKMESPRKYDSSERVLT